MSSPSGRGYGGYGTDKMDQRGTYQDHYRYEFLVRSVLDKTQEYPGL